MTANENSTKDLESLNSTSLFKGYDHMGLNQALNALSSSEEEEPFRIPLEETHSDSEGFINPSDHSLDDGGCSKNVNSKPKNQNRKVFSQEQNNELKGEQFKLNMPILNVRISFAEYNIRFYMLSRSFFSILGNFVNFSFIVVNTIITNVKSRAHVFTSSL